MPTWQRATIILSISCAIFCIAISSHLPQDPGIFVYIFSAHDSPASVITLTMVLTAFLFRDKAGRLNSFFCLSARHANLIACAAFLVCALGALFLYDTQALSMDEYATVFQSRIFSSGHLLGKLPPEILSGLVPSPYHDTFILSERSTGSVASVYWPGQSLVMTPFTFFGVPWLSNPVVTAFTFLALNRLLELLALTPPARGFALLSMLASPAILINGMSYYGMPLQLLCCIIFTLGLIKDTPGWLVTAGFFLALGLCTVNPVSVGLYALPWLIWTIIAKANRWRNVGLMALLGLPVAGLLGIGWKLFLVANFHQAQPASINSDIKAMFGIFTLPSLPILFYREVGIVKLCLWSAPGLPVLAYLASRQPEKWTKLMIASAVSLLLGYCFVPFDQGYGWGYRYFQAAWFVLPVLGAITLQKLSNNLQIREQLYGFAFAMVAGSLILLTPFRAYQAHSLISTQFQRLPVRDVNNGRQIVFVRTDCGFLSTDLIQNDPFLRSMEIRFASRGDTKDAEIASMLGTNPRLVSQAACGERWLLD